MQGGSSAATHCVLVQGACSHTRACHQHKAGSGRCTAAVHITSLEQHGKVARLPRIPGGAAPEAALGEEEKGEKACEEKERGEVLPDSSAASLSCKTLTFLFNEKPLATNSVSITGVQLSEECSGHPPISMKTRVQSWPTLVFTTFCVLVVAWARAHTLDSFSAARMEMYWSAGVTHLALLCDMYCMHSRDTMSWG